MADKWIISDTHFGHENILKFSSKARPFDSIEQHDEALIDNWNSLVKPEDTVIHLGDVAFKPATTLDRVMPRLNGKKKLVFGNHDTYRLEKYLEYFDEILPPFADKNYGILFSHYPVHPRELTFRYNMNVHGHIHDFFVLDAYGNHDRRYINVSVEKTGLKPVAYEELRVKTMIKDIEDRENE